MDFLKLHRSSAFGLNNFAKSLNFSLSVLIKFSDSLFIRSFCALSLGMFDDPPYVFIPFYFGASECG